MLSVIIPSYNRREYLMQCLDSVRAQRVRPLEVIVVDDGSTDRTCEALAERLEDHLTATGQLTPERQWAIDQARFEMARSAWSEDRAEATLMHGSISSRVFVPDGNAAPFLYRLAYRGLGFEAAERLAEFRRGLTRS